MNKKIYMTTGEFARIMRITKETLFHYDEIGLFQPELTQPNGYRQRAAALAFGERGLAGSAAFMPKILS